MFKESTFHEALLKALQQNPEATGTDCLKGWGTFKETKDVLAKSLSSDADYLAGVILKGQGTGSSMGYQLDKFESYMDYFTVVTNLYNECDGEYYVQALSKSVTNFAGFANQLINIYWRTTKDASEFEKMEVAFAAEDIPESAALLGSFVKELLMAEIPDKSGAAYYQDVGQLM